MALKTHSKTSGTASVPTQVSAFIEKIYTFMDMSTHTGSLTEMIATLV